MKGGPRYSRYSCSSGSGMMLKMMMRPTTILHHHYQRMSGAYKQQAQYNGLPYDLHHVHLLAKGRKLLTIPPVSLNEDIKVIQRSYLPYSVIDDE